MCTWHTKETQGTRQENETTKKCIHFVLHLHDLQNIISTTAWSDVLTDVCAESSSAAGNAVVRHSKVGCASIPHAALAEDPSQTILIRSEII